MFLGGFRHIDYGGLGRRVVKEISPINSAHSICWISQIKSVQKRMPIIDAAPLNLNLPPPPILVHPDSVDHTSSSASAAVLRHWCPVPYSFTATYTVVDLLLILMVSVLSSSPWPGAASEERFKTDKVSQVDEQQRKHPDDQPHHHLDRQH